MKYSMISESGALPEAVTEWYASYPARGGISHDNANRLYPHVPPSELLEGIEQELQYDDVLAETDQPAALMLMIGQAVTFMLSNSGNVLTGEAHKFKLMFNTPHHRIWCASYDDNLDQFNADFLAVFGGTPTHETPEIASQMIKEYFAGQVT